MDESIEAMDVDASFTTDDSAKEISQQDEKIQLSNNDKSSTPEVRYENHGGSFTTGIDIFSSEERHKMEERAKRFGLQENVNKSNLEKEEDLYWSMGIAEEDERAKNIRLTVLHMRGTKDMSTKDVFQYFEDYAPASIEWINDVSCNVVWHDKISAARALLRLSKKIVGLGEKVAADRHLKSEASSFDDENKLANDDCIIEVVGDDGSTGDRGNNKIDDDNVISLKDINCPLPPGLWRKGNDCPKSKDILLRFATRADKKQPRAEKMSDYYKKYGNPNFGGIKGLLTESRKRMYKQVRQSKKRIEDEPSDDENRTKRSKNPWGVLSETWGQNDSIEDTFIRPELNVDQKSNVKERLGFKTQPREPIFSEVSPPTNVDNSNSEADSGSSDDEWCKKSKVLRMRMHADDEEEKMIKKRIKQRRNEMHVSIQNQSNDLRSRLRNTRRSPVYRDAIQVVVANTHEKFRLPRARLLQQTDAVMVESQHDEIEEGEDVEEIEAEEPEEGEWVEETKQTDHETMVEEEEEEEEEEEDDSDGSDVSEKEIQGPKGSVIKVVPRAKPRVASTVWARLNNRKSNVASSDRFSSSVNSRGTLKGDLRLRLGSHNRGRSPLRIEVKIDKYADESSGTE